MGCLKLDYYEDFNELRLCESSCQDDQNHSRKVQKSSVETGLSYFGARYYDSKVSLWLSVDPLAEEFAGRSPYEYCFSNPIRFIDPTGMGPDDWKKDVKGEMVYDAGLTRKNASTRLGKGEEYVGESAYQDNGNGTTTFYNEGGTKATAINLQEVKINNPNRGYFQGYFDAYENIEGENPYSPYIPDGYGLTISGSVDYHFTNYYASLSLVSDGHSKKFAGFATFGAGLSTSIIGAGVSVGVDIHDTYGGSDLFGGLKGYSKGGSASFTDFGASHFQSAKLNEKGQIIFNNQGVNTNSIFMNSKPSIGINGVFSYTNRLF
jgi:RHS repeat-associated protein